MATKKILQYLLWDVDGVIVDTEPLKFKAWQGLMESFGKKISVEEYVPFIGHGGKENLKRLLAMKDIAWNDELRLPYRETYMLERENGVPVFKNNVELAQAFKRYFPNVIHAVVSSEKRVIILENLRIAGFEEGFFNTVVSYEDNPTMKRKPAPDMYLFALQKLSATPEACIAFEDTSAGVMAATDAGVFVVALPNGLTTTHDFSRANLIVGSHELRDATAIVRAFQEC